MKALNYKVRIKRYCKNKLNVLFGNMTIQADVEILEPANEEFSYGSNQNPTRVMEAFRMLLDSCVENSEVAYGRLKSWKPRLQGAWSPLKTQHPTTMSIEFELDTKGISSDINPNTNGSTYKFLYASEALKLIKQHIYSVCGMVISPSVCGSGHYGQRYRKDVGHFHFSVIRENLTDDVIQRLLQFAASYQRSCNLEGFKEPAILKKQL